MSDALSSVGSAAVNTIGTVAVVGVAGKAVNTALKSGGSRRSGNRTRKSGNFKVFSGTKNRKSGFNVWK